MGDPMAILRGVFAAAVAIITSLTVALSGQGTSSAAAADDAASTASVTSSPAGELDCASAPQATESTQDRAGTGGQAASDTGDSSGTSVQDDPTDEAQPSGADCLPAPGGQVSTPIPPPAVPSPFVKPASPQSAPRPATTQVPMPSPSPAGMIVRPAPARVAPPAVPTTAVPPSAPAAAAVSPAAPAPAAPQTSAPGSAAETNPPCAGDCLGRFTLKAGAKLPYYYNYSLAGNSAVTQAVLVVHGTGRNAKGYFDSIVKPAKELGIDSKTVLLAPMYQTGEDGPASGDAYWTNGDKTSWKDGGDAVSPVGLSSFEATDEVLRALGDKAKFPNLTRITLVGHSAGGQFVQRYAAGGRAPSELKGISVKFVTANPSSYLYFDTQRPVATGSCPGYNDYKYGMA
ncbi:MAG TPA: hypothetical protein VHU91_00980, partial [Mycobacteriales bacterium]|nr:hypothetical protein [Mycobacteriales bacterium]